jgi:hypothetical protein
MSYKKLFEYEGKGTLNYGDKILSGNFFAFQLNNGNIHLEILLDYLTEFIFELYDKYDKLKFNGKTKEGYIIYSDYFSSISNYPDSHFDNSILNLPFRLKSLEIKYNDNLKYFNSIEFLITNLIIENDSLSLIIPNNPKIEAKIVKLENYDRNVSDLRYYKDIDVTCKLIININSTEEIQRIVNIVDNLCYLISFAKGTKVNFIFYNLKFNDKVLSSYHQNRITKDYSSYSLVDHDSCLKNIIEIVYQKYCKLQSDINFKNLIDIFVDAKSENDLLTLRCLKLVIIMEMLISLFKIKVKSKIEDKCKKEVEGFKVQIKKLFKNIGILNYFEDNDINLFYKIRNSLIHRGKRLTVSNPDEAKKFGLVSKIEEWGFLLYFIDKVFLLMLGYRGKYYNYRKFPILLDSLDKT